MNRAFLPLLVLIAVAGCRHRVRAEPLDMAPRIVPQSTPAPLATWPWAQSRTESVGQGTTRLSAGQADGTRPDLFRPADSNRPVPSRAL